jgi:hypothetical protein
MPGRRARVGRFGLAFVALLALCALASATASAAQKLDLTWNGLENQLKPGETFEMVLGASVYGEVEGPLKIESPAGTVTCQATVAPWSGLSGVDLTNNEVTDLVEMSELGSGALWGGEECPNTSGLGATAIVGVISDSSILNLKGARGLALLKEKSEAYPIYVEVVYSGGATCYYSTKKLKGTLKLEPWVEPGWNQVSLNFEKQKIKLLKEYSAKECLKREVTLSAPFYFQDRGGEPGFGEGYFIFGHLV